MPSSQQPAQRWPVLIAWVLACVCVVGLSVPLFRAGRADSSFVFAVPDLVAFAAVAAAAAGLFLIVLRQVARPADPGLADDAARRMAEQRFQDIAEVASDWIWETDADHRFSYLSSRFFDLSGHRPAEIIGLRRHELIGDVDRPDVKVHLADLEAHRQFSDYVYQAATLDDRWFKVSGKPVFDETGAFAGYRGTGTDITNEVEARQNVDRVRGHLVEALEASNEGFVLYDADDRLVICNERFRAFYGRGGSDLKPGVQFEDVIRSLVASGNVPDAEGDEDAWIRGRLARRQDADASWETRMTDGRWLLVSERRTKDGGTVGIYTDITAIKQREQDLEMHSNMLDAVVDSVPAGLSICDADLNLFAMNDQAIELLELPKELFHGDAHFEDVIRYNAERGEYGDGDVEAMIRERVELARQFQPHRFARARPDGTVIEVIGNPLPGGGFVTVYTDVTEREQALEEQRRAREQAEFASRAKSEFLANMSHELRTPLNAIIGFSEIINQELFGPIGSARYVEYARDIYDSGTHLLSVINDILDLSKAEAGRLRPVIRDIDLAPTVAACLRVVRERAVTGRVALKSTVAEDLPTFPADQRMVKQILLNLLSNAIKFTPEGGKVEVDAALLDSGKLILSVTDTGIGMRPEDIPIALQPFSQIDSSLSRRYEGTGLGLPLTKSLVELQGGVLELDSEVGKGTTVRVIFPGRGARDLVAAG